MRLFSHDGRRLYLNRQEIAALLKSATADPQTYALCLVLAYTGCRLSEALALSPESFDSSEGVVVVRSLKKRRPNVYRYVPIPALVFAAVAEQGDSRRVFPISRTAAWRRITALMETNGVQGPRASPKGFRHGFGVAAVQAGVPLNLIQRWLGHSDLATTAIYMQATGPEERAFADELWGSTKLSF